MQRSDSSPESSGAEFTALPHRLPPAAGSLSRSELLLLPIIEEIYFPYFNPFGLENANILPGKHNEIGHGIFIALFSQYQMEQMIKILR